VHLKDFRQWYLFEVLFGVKMHGILLHYLFSMRKCHMLAIFGDFWVESVLKLVLELKLDF